MGKTAVYSVLRSVRIVKHATIRITIQKMRTGIVNLKRNWHISDYFKLYNSRKNTETINSTQKYML
jgi:hypothetical protein